MVCSVEVHGALTGSLFPIASPVMSGGVCSDRILLGHWDLDEVGAGRYDGGAVAVAGLFVHALSVFLC